MMAEYRQFNTGATRDKDADKFDFEGFLSPLVLERYARYMHANSRMVDGSTRASDNWQKGIPLEAYIKSGWRHFFAWWWAHRNVFTLGESLEDALCGLMFNAMGYLHEHLKKQGLKGQEQPKWCDPKPPYDLISVAIPEGAYPVPVVRKSSSCTETVEPPKPVETDDIPF